MNSTKTQNPALRLHMIHTHIQPQSNHGMWETGVLTDVLHFEMTRAPQGMGLEGNATLPAMCPY